jgi:hypothetical protein
MIFGPVPLTFENSREIYSLYKPYPKPHQVSKVNYLWLIEKGG